VAAAYGGLGRSLGGDEFPLIFGLVKEKGIAARKDRYALFGLMAS